MEIIYNARAGTRAGQMGNVPGLGSLYGHDVRGEEDADGSR